MPVLVTGPETAVGRAAVDALLRTGGEVRVYLDPDHVADEVVEALRRSGCKVGRGGLDDEGRLEYALEQVHTVVHLAGGPTAEPADEVDEAAAVLSAAIGARCRRFVWLSHLGVDAPQGNPYLEACADVEGMLAEAPLESIVFRRALTYGPSDPLTAVLAAGHAPAQVADARHAPIYAGDLAQAVVQADRQRGSAGDLHLVLSIAGPDDLTVGDLARRLAPVAARAAEHLLGPVSLDDHVIDLLGRDLVRTDGVLGGEGTPLDEALARMAG